MVSKLLKFILLFLTVSASASEKDPKAWYPMNGNFNDASGNGHHLKALNDKNTFSEDRELKKGKNTVYGPLRPEEGGGAVGDIPGIDLEKGLTIMGFYRHADNDSGGRIFGFGSEKRNRPGYLVTLSWGIVTVKAGTGAMFRYYRLPRGAWSHLAFVIPPQREKRETRLYINGKLAEASGKKYNAQYVPCPSEFKLGEAVGKNIAGKCFDEIKVFNRVLSEAEIAGEARKSGVPSSSISGTGKGNGRFPVPRFRKPETDPAIRGITEIRFLDSSNLAVVGYYHEFLKKRFEIDCGPFLKLLDTPRYRVKDWSRTFHYQFAGAELTRHYREIIGKTYSDPSGFSLTVNGKEVPTKRFGYWINPISASRFPSMKGGELVLKGSEILHCRYLELETPLRNGDRCRITNTLGEKTEFVYSDENRSEAIKVNQVGYSENAGRKYAYLGIWRGPELGPRDYSAWIGKPFMLVDEKTGQEVFRGKITGRIPDRFCISNVGRERKKRIPFAGEIVCELDFSNFSTPGTYRIKVPDAGVSWPFRIGNDAIGEAFYIRMRGMYQKRCGIAKDPKHTNWPDAACHRITYHGNFPPNDRHYWRGKQNDREDFGFFNRHDERVSVTPFDVIRRNCKPTAVAENVSGGWHDAADYDRRPYHYRAVEAFTSAYLMFPLNFSDGQLNLPESGNGVPDILDEAVWGADLWRKAQNPDGSVGGWIETTAHPGNGSVPGKDPMIYYLSFPTRESTAEYAAAASALALALKKAGDSERSSRFSESAQRAYSFAVDLSRRKCAVLRAYVAEKSKWRKGSVQSLTYRESAQISYLPTGKAAFNLYLLTGEQKYLDDFRKYYREGIGKYIRDMHWRLSPFYFAELATEGAGKPEFEAEYEDFRKRVLEIADDRLKQLNENYAYRMPWYPPDHPYVSHMAWGNGHPMNRGLCFAAAWYLTKDPKYRDAAFLCNDWQLGTNPLGRSMTSGLGKLYPVRFLDLPSQTDGIAEYVPGITPYTYIFQLDYNSIRLAYGLYWEARPDHDFAGVNFALLPAAQDANGTKTPLAAYAENVVCAVPILRRFGNVENWSVSTSEYTVSETIAQAAALTGCLLAPGWKPPRELKERKPADSIIRLPGLMALP